MMGQGRLAAWGIGLAALVALPFVYRDPYHLHILVLILIWSFAYTSWSMMGRFGLVSLGHGGFMGIGAYVTALLWNHLGLSPWIGIPISMVAAGALALIVGYPCFRFRITGHYFVLVTLALSGIVLQVIGAVSILLGFAKLGMDSVVIWLLPRLRVSSPSEIRGALLFEDSYLFLFFAAAVGTATVGTRIVARLEGGVLA